MSVFVLSKILIFPRNSKSSTKIRLQSLIIFNFTSVIFLLISYGPEIITINKSAIFYLAILASKIKIKAGLVAITAFGIYDDDDDDDDTVTMEVVMVMIIGVIIEIEQKNQAFNSPDIKEFSSCVEISTFSNFCVVFKHFQFICKL